MKTRICLILLSLILTLALTGCQGSGAKTDGQTLAAEESSQPPPKKPAPPQNVCKMSWEETCSVEQAFSAGVWVLEDLGLKSSHRSGRTRTVATRDPKTGKTATKRVPVSGNYAKSDGLSAIVKAKSVTGVEYYINILLIPPESCKISITATGPNPPDILKEHSVFIQQKISEAIQNPEPEAIAEPVPYPKTVILEHEVAKVYEILCGWAKNMEFDSQSSRGDAFYKALSFNTGSRIDFRLVMRSIDSNKTKLETDVRNYEGKEEFPVILKSLQEALESIEEKQADLIIEHEVSP